MAIFFGLAAAILWGFGDFLSRSSARILGVWRATFYGQMPGLVIFSAWLVLSPAARDPALHAPLSLWLMTVLAAATATAAGYALTRAFVIGALALVVPITASYGAIAAVLAVSTGERLALLAAVGIVVSTAGVVCAAVGKRRAATTTDFQVAGVGWALLAACGYGVALWLQGHFVIPRMGPQLPLWLTTVSSMATAFVATKARAKSVALPPWSVLPVTWGYGTLTAGAYLSLALGLASGQIAIVSVLSTLSSAVTALLGVALLHERLAKQQWLGIALILVGVSLINAR